ncbi:RluA family pseudouridine synthase [Virgibacillus sp. W0430]|uniref:RluA family pseudouridine synthase n=1 Tax=Virgibacillus sp. W0430 TaxID=3391580 RepID=UPI003F452D41
MHIPILYEDNHLLIVDKPINVPVQADRSGDDDLLTILKNDLKIRYKKPGNVYLGLVHRLDRPVGGVIAFAKTSKAASRLSDMMRRQTIHRTYVAVVKGHPPQQRATLNHYLLKDHRRNVVKVVPPSTNKAKKAVLNYEVIGKTKDYSFVRIQLQTGRPHQIRVQLAAIGCPIVGDYKYSTNDVLKQNGQKLALNAVTLSFDHPTRDERVTVRSNPPYEFPWNFMERSVFHT